MNNMNNIQTALGQTALAQLSVNMRLELAQEMATIMEKLEPRYYSKLENSISQFEEQQIEKSIELAYKFAYIKIMRKYKGQLLGNITIYIYC